MENAPILYFKLFTFFLVVVLIFAYGSSHVYSKLRAMDNIKILIPESLEDDFDMKSKPMYDMFTIGSFILDKAEEKEDQITVHSSENDSGQDQIRSETSSNTSAVMQLPSSGYVSLDSVMPKPITHK